MNGQIITDIIVSIVIITIIAFGIWFGIHEHQRTKTTAYKIAEILDGGYWDASIGDIPDLHDLNIIAEAYFTRELTLTEDELLNLHAKMYALLPQLRARHEQNTEATRNALYSAKGRLLA